VLFDAEPLGSFSAVTIFLKKSLRLLNLALACVSFTRPAKFEMKPLV